MNDQSQMSIQNHSEPLPNATSLPGSVDGRMPLNWRAGQQMNMFGQDHAHANRFRVPADAAVRKINGTCGQNFTASSASIDLQKSLANRLRGRTDLNGSTEYRLIWKSWVMRSGRWITALRASGRPKSDRAYGGWQTPTTRDGKGQSGKGNRIKRGSNGRLHIANLCDQLVDIGRPDLVRSTRFRCWLMGYPELWERVRPTATRSCRK